MKTVYTYNGKPKNAEKMKRTSMILFILAVIALIVWIISMIFGFANDDNDEWMPIILEYIYFIFYFSFTFYQLASLQCVVDDEAGTFKYGAFKSKPMQIADIDKIVRCTNRRGKLRYLNVHEKGVRFMNVKLKENQASLLIAQLQEINPSITVSSINYA